MVRFVPSMGQPSKRLDPDAVLIFAALARAGGVRGAARALGMPRSTVSRKLAELESAAGVPLVVRTARRFALTDVGVQLAARGEELERVLSVSEELVRSASSEPNGTLRLAVAPVLGEEILAAIVADLVQRYPRLSIEARLAVGYQDLRRSGIDVALRTGTIENATDLFALRLGESVTGYYVGRAYAESRGVPKTPTDLEAHDCILVGAPPFAWTFRSGTRELSVAVSGRLRLDSFRVARDAAVGNAGVLRTARVFAEPLVASGQLVPILERFWPSVPIYVVHAGPNPPSPRVRVFIDAAREAVARVLPRDARPPRWRTA
jgi:DNA-binding transcriptional LysR family regulator